MVSPISTVLVAESGSQSVINENCPYLTAYVCNHTSTGAYLSVCSAHHTVNLPVTATVFTGVITPGIYWLPDLWLLSILVESPRTVNTGVCWSTDTRVGNPSCERSVTCFVKACSYCLVCVLEINTFSDCSQSFCARGRSKFRRKEIRSI